MSKADGAMDARAPAGRLAKKRRATRARLLEAAYTIMSDCGVDAAKIKDITDQADVGFGTFYNYFESKDHLASQVLDCLINDLGQRNIAATRGLARKDPALVMPVSIRLVLREVMASPLWQWWAMRPDLLADRMREGFGRFALRDIGEAERRGIFRLAESNFGNAWGSIVWLLVGAIHDVSTGDRPADIASFVTESIMRLVGVGYDDAHRVANARLPTFPEPDIDWSFQLEPPE